MPSGAQPSGDEFQERGKQERKDEVALPPAGDPLIREFENVLLAGNVIDPKTLGAVSQEQLPVVLDLVVSDLQTVGAFRKSIEALCKDPDGSAEKFQDNICAALAMAIREDCLANPLAAFSPLTGILNVTETVVSAINCHSPKGEPPALTALCAELVRLIAALSNYRTGSEFEWGDDAIAQRLGDKALIGMWDVLNTACFDALIRALRVGGYVPSRTFLAECGSLLDAFMVAQDYDQGPQHSTTEVEARAWTNALRLAATLGAVGLGEVVEGNSKRIKSIARGLVKWRRGDVVMDECDPAEMRRMYDCLADCELYALRALASCENGGSVLSLWKEVLREYPTTSRPYRLALFCIAKSRIEATSKGVVAILSELGGGDGTPWEDRRHIDTIVRFLGFPGSESVLEYAFDVQRKPSVPIEFQHRVKELLKARYHRHAAAAPNVADALRRCESEGDQSEQAIRQTPEGKDFIWNSRARLALKTFDEIFE